MHVAYLARQPIFDRQLDVWAYELLYRSRPDALSMGACGDEASSKVLLNIFSTLNAEHLTEHQPVLVNVTEKIMHNLADINYQQENITLEILEDIPATAQNIAVINQLKKNGYRIALDDFVLTQDSEQFLPLADIVKLDVVALAEADLIAHVEQIKALNLKIVAEKVEDHEMYQQCMDLGVDYFQGFFLCRPRTLARSRIPVNRAALLKLINKLHDPIIGADEISDLIAQDPLLSYKLLHLYQAVVLKSKQVSSLKEVVKILGIGAIRNWANVILLANIDDAPHALLTTSLIRGKMCQLLGEKIQFEPLDLLFTVGLFSTLDAMLDLSMSRLLETISISEEIKEALVYKRGVAGRLLSIVIAYEQANWEKVRYPGLAPGDPMDAYFSAVKWVNETGVALGRG